MPRAVWKSAEVHTDSGRDLEPGVPHRMVGERKQETPGV